MIQKYFTINNKRLFLVAAVSTILICSACSDLIKEFDKAQWLLLAFFGDHNTIIPRNAVGATTSTALRPLDFTPSDSNAVFVSKSGNDANLGNRSAPKLTLSGTTGAISACTAAKQSIMILDSGTYEETGFTMTGNIKGIYADLGCKPVMRLKQNNDYFSVSEVKSETSFTTHSINYLSATTLKNGNVLIVYQDNTDAHKANFKVIKPESWAIITEGTLPITDILCIAATTLPNGDVFLAYDGSTVRTGKYMVINPADWSVVQAETSFNTCTTGPLSALMLSQGTILIAFNDYDAMQVKYIVLDPTNWTITKSETIISANAWFISTTLLNNGDILFFYGGGYPTSEKGRYQIIDADNWGTVIPETPITTDNIIGTSVSTLSNGNILFAFSIVSQCAKYMVLDQNNYSVIIPETIFHGGSGFSTFEIGSTILQNGQIVIAYDDINDSQKGQYVVLAPKLDQHILVSTDVSFSGITFIPADDAYLTSMIQGSSSRIFARWCDFNSCKSSTTCIQSSVIDSDYEINISNCRFFNSLDAINLAANKASIYDSQFYNNSGTGIRINGAAAAPDDITINHCDFFNNQNGIWLENNNGANEEIKNSIFHDNTGFDISADAPITITNSVVTGTVQNANMGAGIATSDPLYINEGVSDPDAIDLNLQTIFMGYPLDSPAKELADDGRNAGALDVEYGVR